MTLGILLTDPADIRVVERAIGVGVHLLWCTTTSQLVSVAKRPDVGGLIAQPHDISGVGLGDALQGTASHTVTKPVLVYTNIAPPACAEIRRLATDGRKIQVVLRGFDDFAAAILSFSAGLDVADAIVPILNAIHDCIPKLVEDIVVGSVMVGRRRARLPELARLCRQSERTLDRRIESVGLPTAAALMASALVLHSIWRMERLQWSRKRSADAACFRSAESMTRYIERRTGSPLQELQRLGFNGLLQRFRTALTLAKG